jgi:Tfp pilus assembly protein PilX
MQSLKSISPARFRRGGILISALAFTIITALMLTGIATLTVSYYARSRVESDYAATLGIAEAGVNYELNKISLDISKADLVAANSTYNFGSGTFNVTCTNKDGTSWIAPNPLYVTSTSTLNGVSRTVRISAKGYPWNGKFAIYSVDNISVWRGSSANVTGDVGTNNILDFSGTPTINGNVYFNGPSADWYAGINPGNYSVVRNSRPETWYTVDELANQKFPASIYGTSGLTYLATHNNNASANPPIVGNSITSSTTLKGPGDYYVTNIDLTGNNKITFDNTNGPVNIWVGPSGGTGTARFRGGTGAISALTDPTKINNIYVATQSGIDMAGNETIDAVIYAYNKDALGNEYGIAQNSGNPTINGRVLANQVDINGNITVNYVQNTIVPSNYAYFGFDNQWTELNGLY